MNIPENLPPASQPHGDVSQQLKVVIPPITIPERGIVKPKPLTGHKFKVENTGFSFPSTPRSFFRDQEKS